jgi:hypothetical protein
LNCYDMTVNSEIASANKKSMTIFIVSLRFLMADD